MSGNFAVVGINTDDFFGLEVAISDDWVVIGAPGDNLNRGAAYVYQFDGTNWNPSQTLTYGAGAASFDNFGRAISIEGSKMLIGSYQDDDLGTNSGTVTVFDYNGMWFENQKLNADDGAAADLFGIDLAMSANRALIGAIGDDNNWIDDGAAYLVCLGTDSRVKALSIAQASSRSCRVP